MAPFVTCKQYYRAITPYVNAIKKMKPFHTKNNDSVSTENMKVTYLQHLTNTGSWSVTDILV